METELKKKKRKKKKLEERNRRKKMVKEIDRFTVRTKDLHLSGCKIRLQYFLKIFYQIYMEPEVCNGELVSLYIKEK